MLYEFVYNVLGIVLVSSSIALAAHMRSCVCCSVLSELKTCNLLHVSFSFVTRNCKKVFMREREREREREIFKCAISVEKQAFPDPTSCNLHLFITLPNREKSFAKHETICICKTGTTIKNNEIICSNRNLLVNFSLSSRF